MASEPTPAPEPAAPVLVALGLLVYVAVAALAAVIALFLVPLRIGTVLFPVCVLLGAATNVLLPLLVRQLTASTLAAAVPVAAWFICLALLTSSRSEGDVLIPGGHEYESLTYVFYALALAGTVAGVTTVVRSEPRRGRRVRAEPAAGRRQQPSKPR